MTNDNEHTPADSLQFQEDVQWCLKQIHQHFSQIPYWEECFTANFSRKEKTYEQYWQELNRMTLFSMNVMASTLLNRKAEHPIDTKPLENIVNMTNRHLSVRAPHSLSEHDALLKELQNGINDYCDAIGEPSTDFIDFADKMNLLRVSIQSQAPQ